MRDWVKSYVTKKGGGGNFILWANGETRLIRFLVDPEDHALPLGEHFIQASRQFVYCPSTEKILYEERSWKELDCPICHQLNSGPYIRLCCLVLDLTDNNRVKILAQGKTFWQKIFERREELEAAGDSLLNYGWSVTREGERESTTYKILKEARPSPLPANIIFPPGVDKSNLWKWFENYIEDRKKTFSDLVKEANVLRSGVELEANEQHFPLSPPFTPETDKGCSLTNLFKAESSTPPHPPNLLEAIEGSLEEESGEQLIRW